ncbi:MAG: agmatinase [Acidobacteriota bacterium]
MFLFPSADGCTNLARMSPYSLTFGGLDADEAGAPDAAQVVVLPVAYERTVSYGRGTADGPDAILRASAYVELYDEELDREPIAQGVHTLPILQPAAFDLADALDEIERAARAPLEAGRFLVTLGGEHGLTLAPVRAARAVFGDALGVIQFDAHADLRDRYEGTPHSHASVMKRIVDLGLPTAAIGLRALSQPEAALIRARDLPVIWGHQLDRIDGTDFDRLLDRLPERVYLTFDLDFFDPSLVPATGTPEPGGGFWWPTMRLLRRLFARKTVVAMDVVELAPRPGHPASDFVAARLVYKCLGYREVGRG